MISWMQRHRKYLVVTIWISTIAFIGAGFVGWGQYSYGDKASALARVGEVPISQRSFQQAYSRLYAQYNQLFQGNFDETRAKEFGLQQQAFRSLIDGALILNLAKTLHLEVSDSELLEEIKSQSYFFKDGSFDKDTYQKVLHQNKLTMKEYEEDTRNAMLTEKTLAFFATQPASLETMALAGATMIADRLQYKILNADAISVTPETEALKSYWEGKQFNYMTAPRYTLETITVAINPSHPTPEEIEEYYNANKHNFTAPDGKILSLEEAKSAVVAALDDKAANKEALKTYIAYKKEDPSNHFETASITIDAENSPYDAALFTEITELTPEKAYLKPRKVGDAYQIIKLVSSEPSKPKTFEQAEAEVRAEYVSEQKQLKLQELATQSLQNFTGNATEFLTRDDVSKIKGLETPESTEFLAKVFESKNKRGYVEVGNGKVVLYEVLEQKMLHDTITNQDQNVMGTKSMILDRGLITVLEEKYPTEIYVKGL